MTTVENHTGAASGEAPGPLPSDLREGYAEVGDVRRHYVEAGEGPLIVLLHGFPEFWYGWRQQIGPLAAAGFRVVAPDMRGYNLSSRPDGVAAYDTDQLTTDICGLIRERGAQSAMLVGHDWGGTGCGTGGVAGARSRRAAGERRTGTAGLGAGRAAGRS